MELNGKRILVTGADGFIGSHLAERLTDAKARVRALVQYNSFNHWGWLEGSSRASKIEIVAGDIRDAHFCEDLLKDIDVVFHLAALIAIPYSYRAPSSYVDTNVKGTLNICQAALLHKVQRVIHTSTSEVYGTAQYVPIDEKHPLQPQSPYSAAKIGSDAMALSFYHSYGLPLVIARLFNTYGPRQSARAVIPTMISQMAAGKTDIQLGDLTTTRDYMFVEDSCAAFIAIAAMEGHTGEVFNAGTGREISIKDLFLMIQRLMNSSARPVLEKGRLRPPQSEVFRLCCDNRKLLAASDFRPRVTLEEGLQRTIDWFNRPENLSQYKVAAYNV